MYKPGDKIGFFHARDSVREVLAVRGNRVFWLSHDSRNAFVDPLESTFPLPPEGREVEAEWRVPKKGDTYYDSGTQKWSVAPGDTILTIATDPINLGWRRPVLVPVKANRLKGLRVNDLGEAIVDTLDGPMLLRDLQRMHETGLSVMGFTDADIALIHAGLPADVQRYLDSKPADAEAELRESKPGEWFQTMACGEWIRHAPECLHGAADWPYLGRRRWIRKAAVTTMNVQGGIIVPPATTSPVPPLPPVQVTHRHANPPTYRPPRKGEWYLGNKTAGDVFLATCDCSTPAWIVEPMSPVTAEVVHPKLPELWLAVWPTLEGGCHESTHAYRTREEAESRATGGAIIVRIPASGGAA